MILKLNFRHVQSNSGVPELDDTQADNRHQKKA